MAGRRRGSSKNLLATVLQWTKTGKFDALFVILAILLVILLVLILLDILRWEDRLSSSSQNNLVNLSSGQQLPDRPDSRYYPELGGNVLNTSQ